MYRLKHLIAVFPLPEEYHKWIEELMEKCDFKFFDAKRVAKLHLNKWLQDQFKELFNADSAFFIYREGIPAEFHLVLSEGIRLMNFLVVEEQFEHHATKIFDFLKDAEAGLMKEISENGQTAVYNLDNLIPSYAKYYLSR